MKYVYLGDRDIIDYYGMAFIRGEPVEVFDSFILGKIAKNCDFKEVIVSDDVEVVLATHPIIKKHKKGHR